MSETAVLARIEYYPYGEVYSMSGGGSVYTFLGKEDPGVGMLDFGPRYYNAVLGRFFSPDPILASASAYSYGEGNPIMLYDPSGMACIPPPPPLFDISSIHSPNVTMGDLDDHDPFSPNYCGDGSGWNPLNEDLNREQDRQERREKWECAIALGADIKVEVFVWGLDACNLNGVDDGTTAGHMSIEVSLVWEDGTTEGVYESKWKGDTGEHTYRQDLQTYDSFCAYDVTGYFGGTGNMLDVADAVADFTSDGSYSLDNNCVDAVMQDLDAGGYSGPRPARDYGGIANTPMELAVRWNRDGVPSQSYRTNEYGIWPDGAYKRLMGL